MFGATKADEAVVRPQGASEVRRDPVESHQPVIRPQAPVAPTAPRPVPVAPVRVAAPAATPAAAPVAKPVAPAAASASSAQLIAGPGVTLKGDMQCDMLRVEGSIEGNVKARKLVVAAGGTLVGTAEIEDAEIEGRFEGTLAVSGHLIVRASGRVSGKFQYGEIEIERGGAIAGEIAGFGQAAAPEPVRSPDVDSRPARTGMFGRA